MIIQKAEYLISSPSLEACPIGDRPEYAFIGRSNVGKSSLINMLTGIKQLAKISSTPGKTQLINHFEIKSKIALEEKKVEKWYLVDLPGYGFAKVSESQRKQWKKMIEAYIQQRENLVNLFVLVDARHKPQKLDLDFINKLGEWRIPFAIVFTKADKETQKTVSAHVKAFGDAMRRKWTEIPPIFVTSSEKRMGKKYILDMIQEMNKDYFNHHSITKK